MVNLVWPVLLALADAPPCGAVAVSSDAPVTRYHDDDTPRRATVYLNFSGGYVAHPLQQLGTSDNSAENLSVLVPIEGLDFPAYAGDEQTAIAVVQAVETDLAPYGVRVRYLERPAARVPYTMVMMGGSASLLGLDVPHSGYAPIDCTLTTMRPIVYVFNGDGAVADQANTVTHEIAHAWGIDHTLGDMDVMSYTGTGIDKDLLPGCRDYCTTECLGGTIFCTERHEEYCPPGQQDAVAELLHAFGGDEPDTEPPQATIVAPEDGAVFDEGEGVPIEAEITDDFGNFGWDLRIEHDGDVIYDRADYTGVPAWYLDAPEVGTYRITLTAEDHAGHVVIDEIEIEVRAEGEGDTADDGTSTGAMDPSSDGDDSGAPPESESGTDTGASETDAGASSPAGDGCGCRSRTTREATPLWLVATLVAARRARRRSPRRQRSSASTSCAAST